MTVTATRDTFCTSYYQGAELGDLQLWWEQCGAGLIDFATGYTFTVEIGQPWQSAIVTKTTGVTGAVGSGEPDGGSPNLTIAWDAGELDALTPGDWVIEITATQTLDSRDRKLQGRLTIDPEVLA